MSEWKKVKLGDVCSIKTGKLDSNAAVENGKYPFFTCDPKTLAINIWAYDTEAILLAGNNASGNYTAKYYYGKFNAYQRTYIIESLDKNVANVRYLTYAMNQQLQLLKIMSSGSTTKFITMKMLSPLELPLPPLSTQHRIATILSRYDSLIENYQKQIKLLEEAAQRLYKEWFIDLHFPGHENTNIIDGVPEGWEKKKLCEIAEVVMGSSPKSEFYNTDKQGLPFHQGVGSYGVRFVEDNVYSTAITRLAEANSILFSVRAPVGRLNITKNKIIIGRGLAAMNHKQGYQSFLFYMLKERFFKDNIIGNGSIFASISKEDLLNQVFIVPPMKIVKAFESLASKLDKKIQSVDTQLRLLSEARDRLLPKLMSGEIVA